MLTPASSIAILGFGAAGRRIAAQLTPRGCALRAFDPARAQDIEAAGVDAMNDLATTLRGVRLVFDDREAHAAATPGDALRTYLQPGQILVDLRGREAQQLSGAFDVTGGAPHTLLICGPRAEALASALTTLGLPSRATSPEMVRAARAQDDDTAPFAPSPVVIRRGELP